MVVANDALWSAKHLKSEGSYAEPLARLVDQIRRSGFSRQFPPALLKRIADPTTSSINSSPPVDLNDLLTTLGDAELNVLITILGFSQTPRLLSSTGRTKHYPAVLEAILQRIGVRLDLERQSVRQTRPLTAFFSNDVDICRDLLFIYFDVDCARKWSITKEMQVSLRTEVLRIFNRFHLSLVKSEENSSSGQGTQGGSPNDRNSSYAGNVLSIPPYSILAALADFVTYQMPFKDGLDMEERLKIVFHSPLSDAIQRYLPTERDVRDFVSHTWDPSSPRKRDPFVIDPIDTDGAFGAALRIMTHASSCAWVCAPSVDFPSSMQQYTFKQQKNHARKLRKLGKKANDITKVLKVTDESHAKMPNLPHPGMLEGTQSSRFGRMRIRLAASTVRGKHSSRSRRLLKLKQVNRQIAAVGLGLESETWVEELGVVGMFRELRTFSERIGNEVPDVSNTDGERQAVRNLWACFALETILFQQNPSSNDAIFGYCMIYPKTDNFLDNKDVSREDKIAFQKAFHKRIRGDPTPDITDNASLKKVLNEVSDFIGLIEGHWPRQQYPSLFTSALSLNTAQTLSLTYQQAKQKDRSKVLEVSLYKGGISVLTDAFLVRGRVSLQEAGFSFVLGCCLQMMDDLQDVSEDAANGVRTPYTPDSTSDVKEQTQLANANGIRLFWFLSQIWASQEGGTDNGRLEKKLQRTASSQRNDVVIKTSLRLSQMMALKALFRGQSIFTEPFLHEASKRCTLEPDAMLKLRGITFLHKMARLDYI